MMTMMMEGFLILITMKMTSVKPLKEKSQKAISVMTIRSSSCSSCPSYPSSSSFLTANSLYNLQTVHGLVRHFLEAGEDGGLPLGLDLEAIQLEDQYQNTEYGPVSKMQSQRLDSTSMKLMTPIWIWNHRLLLCRLWDHRLVLYRWKMSRNLLLTCTSTIPTCLNWKWLWGYLLITPACLAQSGLLFARS